MVVVYDTKLTSSSEKKTEIYMNIENNYSWETTEGWMNNFWGAVESTRQNIEGLETVGSPGAAGILQNRDASEHHCLCPLPLQ